MEVLQRMWPNRFSLGHHWVSIFLQFSLPLACIAFNLVAGFCKATEAECSRVAQP
jgi:hypothetical protein